MVAAGAAATTTTTMIMIMMTVLNSGFIVFNSVDDKEAFYLA